MERKLVLKKGTIVDSTFIESPSSTKNKEKKRDPEAHSAKKGNTWHFGYKAHIGVDKESGLVHTVKATPANEHDVTVMSKLLHKEYFSVSKDPIPRSCETDCQTVHSLLQMHRCHQ